MDNVSVCVANIHVDQSLLDTFVVAAGGYVVVQFRSDNPGYWLSHCHMELHQREGMALVIREAVDKIMEPPDEMETCNSFIWDVHDFMSAIEGGTGTIVPHMTISSVSVLIGMLLLIE